MSDLHKTRVYADSVITVCLLVYVSSNCINMAGNIRIYGTDMDNGLAVHREFNDIRFHTRPPVIQNSIGLLPTR